MSPGSGFPTQSVTSSIECDHCGFSVDQSTTLERCPRCWRPLESKEVEPEFAPASELVFAEATFEEIETKEPECLIEVPEEEIVPEEDFQTRAKRLLAGYGVSLLIHTTLMLAMALIVYQVQSFQWHNSIQSSLTDGLDVLGKAGGLEVMKPIDFKVKSTLDSEALTNAAYHSANMMNAGEGGTTTGAGDGGIGFFGTRSKGDSFAFVVDISGSMTAEFKDNDSEQDGVSRIKTRWDKAREELLAAINAMSEDQSYCVVLYNDGHMPMIEEGRAVGLRKATSSNKEKTRLWLERMSASGSTNPQESLAFALDLRPDVLYFLTDGAIPPDSRDVAAAFNQKQTVIHTTCIGFAQNDILQLISADHRGQFRSIGPRGESSTPHGISLVVLVRESTSQRQKLLRLEKDYERLLEWIEDPDIDFKSQNTHSVFLLHNAVSAVDEFSSELVRFTKNLNVEGIDGFNQSIQGGLLGVKVPLDSDRRLNDPKEIESHRQQRMRVNQILKTVVSDTLYDTFDHNVRAIYLFGDVEAKEELRAGLEVFDLFNGSQIEIIDGDQFVRDNR